MSSSLEVWKSKYRLDVKGTVHAGAHLAQERFLYQDLSMEPVLWIEAHPEIEKKAKSLLENFPNQEVVHAALWSVSNHEITLSEAGNEGSSSSLLELGLITGSHPQVICTNEIKLQTNTLYEILSARVAFTRNMNFLCIDTQGAEREVIIGLGKKISQFDYILAEVSIRRLYKGAVLFEELTGLLSSLDFNLVASNVNQNTGWGDALFIRNSEVSRLNLDINDFEHILVSDGTALVTKLRYFLLKLGFSNDFVAKFSRKS